MINLGYLLIQTIYKTKSSIKTFVFRKLIGCDSSVVFGSLSKVINISKKNDAILIKSNSRINGELLIFGHGGKIEIGNYCYVGEGARIWSSCSIVIEDRVLIAHGVNIHDNNSHPIDSAERYEHFKHIIEKGHPRSISLLENRVIIQKDAWIGFNSSILKGVTIGEGAIIAAGSVVVKNVDPFTLVGGNPAVFIKKLK